MWTFPYKTSAIPTIHPVVTIEQLEAAIPEINWRKGHSGELMTIDQEDSFWEDFYDLIFNH